MPIVTKKDKLSISMTWSPSDDSYEVDIGVQRDGNEDVTVSLQVGKSTVTVGAACIKELFDFLVSRDIIDVPKPVDAKPSPALAAGGTEGAVYASSDVLALLAETRKHLAPSTPQHPFVQSHRPQDTVYTTPTMIAANRSAVVAPPVSRVPIDAIAESNIPTQEAEDSDDLIEMSEVPPDIFGR